MTAVRRYLPFCLLLSLLPAPALAAEALPSPTGSLMQMLLGLGLTLAFLFAGLYALKRLQGSRQTQPGALRILSATSVGTREKVVLLAVGKQVLVLGVAPGRITALHTMAEEDFPVAPPAPPLPSAGEFANRLKHMLERRREK